MRNNNEEERGEVVSPSLRKKNRVNRVTHTAKRKEAAAAAAV
jgi:hypothetical protein